MKSGINMELNFIFAIAEETPIKEEFLRWLFLLGSFVIVFLVHEYSLRTD